MNRITEIPTIDVSLVTIKYNNLEYALDTADKIKVKPDIETQKATKLIVKNILLSQKRATNTLTGHTITLSDNVFIPEVVKIIQGGVLTFAPTLLCGTANALTNVLSITPTPADGIDPASIEIIKPNTANATLSVVVANNVVTVNLATGTDSAISSTLADVKKALDDSNDAKVLVTTTVVGLGTTLATAVQKTELGLQIASYTPPVAGQKLTLPVFELCAYSAINDASGLTVGYEKITYPNCTGEPIELDSEDNKFRSPEYTITSAPDKGQAPYKIEYIGKDDLPVVA